MVKGKLNNGEGKWIELLKNLGLVKDVSDGALIPKVGKDGYLH